MCSATFAEPRRRVDVTLFFKGAAQVNNKLILVLDAYIRPSILSLDRDEVYAIVHSALPL